MADSGATLAFKSGARSIEVSSFVEASVVAGGTAELKMRLVAWTGRWTGAE